MKRIILLALACSFFTIANAQRHKLQDDALDKMVLEVSIEGPSMAALDLQKELDLTQEQYKQVLEVNQKRFAQILEAEELYRDDALLRSKSIYAINMEADKALGSMLDPKQLRIFMELDGRQQIRFVSDNAEE